MIGTCIASGCAAFACWMSMVKPRAASRLPDIGQWANHDEPVVVADAAWTMLAHAEGKCVIIVTHSPEVAAQSDEVFQLAPLRER